ncbi:MAG: hypothetical protein AAB254_07210, partial [candidate division NC10 bacterium]
MGRLPGIPGHAGRGVIDIHAYDVPLARKLPRLSERLGGGLPEAGPDLPRGEAAKLSDLIEDMDRARVT